MADQTIRLALTGASDMGYGLRLLECLLAQSAQVRLLVSQVAHKVGIKARIVRWDMPWPRIFHVVVGGP